MILITNGRRFVVFILGVSLLAGIALLSGNIFSDQIRKNGEFILAEGASARSVWKGLGSQGFARNSWAWRYQAWKLDAANRLKSGTYQLTAGESASQVITRFINGDTVTDELSLVYPEGFTLDQIASRTASRNLGTVADFESAAHPAKYAEEFEFLSAIPANRNLEGYLFPDTYQVFADDKAEDVILRMLANFDRKLTDDLRQEITTSGHTLDEIVIMASIIEREVLTDSDMGTVAGILWKRLNENMGLDVDATVRYALDKWDDPLTAADLATDSPYNTRKYAGLPPGPISNPGLRALTAAIRPQASEFYYYLSAPDGTTHFARTNDEHNQNKAKYLR